MFTFEKKQKMKKTIVVLTLFTFASCGGGEDVQGQTIEENKEGVGSVYENTESARQRIIQEAEGLQTSKADLTTLSFDKMEHDFGVVKPESVSITEFTVTNTGTLPLIIEDVSASCGCTTPQKPENPIAPGQSDVIKVEFKPKATQLGAQNKTVTVKSNTQGGITILKVKALVEE